MPVAPAQLPSEPTKTPVRSIAFLALAAFASAATLRIADPLLPQLGQDFGVTTGAAAIVVTAFSVSYGLLQVFFGPVGDRFGKVLTIAVVSFLSALTVLACALAPSLEWLTAARFASGAAAAAIIPLSMAWIGDTVPYEDRQPILARFLSGQILGLVFGQAGAGILGEYLGWRLVFVVLAGLYVVAGTCLVIEMMRDPSGRTRATSMNAAGFITSLRQTAGLFRRRWVRIVLLTVFLEGFLAFGSFAFVASELQHRYAIGPAAAGSMLVAYGAGGLIYAWNSPVLVRRLGERGLAVGGGFVMGAAFLMLALLPALAVAPLAIVLSGLGFYMLHNTLQTNATQMAPEARGAAVSLFASGLFLGQTAGVAVVALFFDRYGGAPAFLAAAALLPILGLWFSRKLATRESPTIE